jgi:micrococcal nuclease
MLGRMLATAILSLGLAAGCGGTEAAEAPTSAAGTAESAPPSASAGATHDARGTRAVVAAVVDGDTIELRNGRRVRLLQIDTPELGSHECYAREAAEALRKILPAGTEVRLTADRKLDRRDRYGRLLRYVFEGNRNVNLTLVEQGAASVWFYQGDRGRYATRLMRMARAAKADAIGLWGACPDTPLDPLHAVDTGS